jgi:ribulose-phosphate 3-epimerase
MIKEAGCKAGLVFNPATPLQVLENVMDKLDKLLHLTWQNLLPKLMGQ